MVEFFTSNLSRLVCVPVFENLIRNIILFNTANLPKRSQNCVLVCALRKSEFTNYVKIVYFLLMILSYFLLLEDSRNS